MKTSPDLPAGAIPPKTTAAVLAVVAGSRSTEDVARFCGWPARSTAYKFLLRAREADLVFWPQGTKGAIHPLVGLVPWGSGSSRG